MVNVSDLFKPPFKTHLGLNNRLHILFRIQIHVFFHSTQLRVDGVCAIRRYSVLCRQMAQQILFGADCIRLLRKLRLSSTA